MAPSPSQTRIKVPSEFDADDDTFPTDPTPAHQKMYVEMRRKHWKNQVPKNAPKRRQKMAPAPKKKRWRNQPKVIKNVWYLPLIHS